MSEPLVSRRCACGCDKPSWRALAKSRCWFWGVAHAEVALRRGTDEQKRKAVAYFAWREEVRARGRPKKRRMSAEIGESLNDYWERATVADDIGKEWAGKRRKEDDGV